uniref:Gamma-secretase subunit PEN-2 n=1 Tax=Timspurckia oligopyrenoides TaxID=708627 RepID=A0A7S0ZB78_9RHOD|mmetsp:Transcript_10985/g.19844  ORF Transcript_10985/g.19844 Transcript_10985/m.19844 type:complete len:180 (+) Transcript_10985:62-601(+)
MENASGVGMNGGNSGGVPQTTNNSEAASSSVPNVGGKNSTSAADERIRRLQQQAREYEEIERKRHERRLEKQEEKRLAAIKRQEDHELELKSTAKRMFYIGCALLPLMWAVMIMYFWKEFRDPNADESIKMYCRWSIYGLVIVNLIWIAWYTVFVVFSDTSLSFMNLVLHETSFAPINI